MGHEIAIKRIVAAVGFGDWTHAVLQTAAEMGVTYGADVVAMYAEQFAPPVYFSNQKVVAELVARREAAKAHLEKCVREYIGDRVRCETRLVEMPPVDAIVKTVDAVGADLLVMGPHKRRGLKRLMLGAVPETVFRLVDIPILTVRGRGPEASGHYRKILCPVNFTSVAREVLHCAADMASRCKAELEVMCCVEEGDEAQTLSGYERKLVDWVPNEIQARCTLNTAVRRGEAAEEIVKTAREGGHDLVVIGAQRRPLLEATVYGTTSIRTMRWAPCPVLAVTR